MRCGASNNILYVCEQLHELAYIQQTWVSGLIFYHPKSQKSSMFNEIQNDLVKSDIHQPDNISCDNPLRLEELKAFLTLVYSTPE